MKAMVLVMAKEGQGNPIVLGMIKVSFFSFHLSLLKHIFDRVAFLLIFARIGM